MKGKQHVGKLRSEMPTLGSLSSTEVHLLKLHLSSNTHPQSQNLQRLLWKSTTKKPTYFFVILTEYQDRLPKGCGVPSLEICRSCLDTDGGTLLWVSLLKRSGLQGPRGPYHINHSISQTHHFYRETMFCLSMLKEGTQKSNRLSCIT